jgi:hypothetical protein
VYIVGILAQRQAGYDQATDLITQSLSMFRTCGDPAGITACLARLNELQMNPSQ